MITIFSILLLLGIATYIFISQDKFGSEAEGLRLETMKNSKHFRNGKFYNLSLTPQLAEGYTMAGIIWDFFFVRHPRRRPVDAIPSEKNDLHKLPADSDVLVWFGHSSYYIQVGGKKFLIDPVFSGSASPVPGNITSFEGTDRYTADDIPDIDCILITHDHYDHLDYESMLRLKGRTKRLICGLGVGAHLEHWGFDISKIEEKDWYEKVDIGNGFIIHVEPARHFSGRSFVRNNTLWASYLLECPGMKIYIGGDSGYDTHYAEIGLKHGPIDLALLDNGQYDKRWRYIHNMPEEVAIAAKDLQAKKLIPVHSSKFAMSLHSWDEPLIRISAIAAEAGIALLTPRIGEIVPLHSDLTSFPKWWEGRK